MIGIVVPKIKQKVNMQCFILILMALYLWRYTSAYYASYLLNEWMNETSRISSGSLDNGQHCALDYTGFALTMCLYNVLISVIIKIMPV